MVWATQRTSACFVALCIDTRYSIDLDMEEQERKLELQRLLHNQLSRVHFQVLKFLCSFLHQVSEHNADNKMSPDNIAICFGPNVLRDPDEGGAVCWWLVVFLSSVCMCHGSVLIVLQLDSPIHMESRSARLCSRRL